MSSQQVNMSERDRNTSFSLRQSRNEVLHTAASSYQHQKAAPISISQSFGPDTAQNLDRPPVNVILITYDPVGYYVDEYTLLKYSNNHFKGLLPLAYKEKEKRLIFLRDISSSELDIVLQAIYNIAQSTTTPGSGVGSALDFQVLAKGIGWLSIFGIPPKAVIVPHTHLFDRILSFAPLHPLETYSFAGQHDIEDLARAASSHTLSVDLSNISEELALQMGALYLSRLFRLHVGREGILKGLLEKEPNFHNETEECRIENQTILREKWNMAIATLTWEIKANTPTSLIRETVIARTSCITCNDCIKARDTRLSTILTEWSMATRTI
ncbi:hypothetical protein Moror_16485 [Moniliophthora roreri MCA 2997]|uniref:BTB domain-containing protein n=2 Tax=Moniliophthora roreri TaxID=221103 RepID=V2XAT4_MONRO|nr:hypothetical protein Moror_16485 [Moniliophthora roreri MCA 2997]